MSDPTPNAPRRGGSVTIEIPAETPADVVEAAIDAALRGPEPEQPAPPAEA